MKQESTLPDRWFEQAGRVFALETKQARNHRRHLQLLLADAAQNGAKTWLLDCSFAVGGPWAGVKDFFECLIHDIQADRPDLFKKHDYELVHVLPALKRIVKVSNPTLTDLAPPEERSRNYPADRAFRIVHGLIEMLDEWKQASDATPWALVCHNYGSASHIGRRFFDELMRRRGKRLHLTLVTVSAGADRPHPCGVDQAEMSLRAQELENRIGNDGCEIQVHLPDLIRAWRLVGRLDKVLKWCYRGLDIYNNLGLYEDAILYGEEARTLFTVYGAGDKELHWRIFVKLFMSYVGIRKIDEAYRLAEEEVLGKEEDPDRLSWLCYLLAMLHARYLPERNLAKAEKYLEDGVCHLRKTNLPEERFHFQFVFNRNGLALVRHLQGRHQDAIDLCRSGYERLITYLDQDQHRLHRSVLLYNMAQVYSAVRVYDEALVHYAAAIEMDPNYSEYYNERGNIYLKLGRWQEAVTDYLKAIELSPPYYEVWTNLGQCYRSMGKAEEAVVAYSRSLDLEPDQVLALLGRAQAQEAAGQVDAAIADYSAALTIEPQQWEAIASRAILYYEKRKLSECLTEMNRAIELAPTVADLYQNRSIVLADLGRLAEAADDLQKYLDLKPDSEDRTEVEARRNALAKDLQTVSDPRDAATAILPADKGGK